MTATKPIKIFSCCADRDKESLGELKKHLKTLEGQYGIILYDNLSIPPGVIRHQEIINYLSSADIILLFVSVDFINSDECYNVALEKALERHRARQARVIPIILRPVNWQATPLRELQAIPRNGQPVTKRSRRGRDAAFNDVAQAIGLVVKELHMQRAGRPQGQPQMPSGYTTPRGQPQAPSSNTSPQGWPQAPSGQTASRGQPQAPSGQTAPQGQSRTPSGHRASPSWPQTPSGHTARPGQSQTPPGRTVPRGQPPAPSGYTAPRGWSQISSNPLVGYKIDTMRPIFVAIAVVILVFTCIATCSLGPILSSLGRPPSTHSPSNPTSQRASTPVDSSDQLRTALAQTGSSFATANAQALNTAFPDPYAPKWSNVLLVDPLDQAGYWQDQVSDAHNATCKFSGGAYHVTQPGPQGFYKCISSLQHSSQFTFQVTMTIIQGDCGGIIFYADFAVNSFYIFTVCQDRHFALIHYMGDTVEQLATGDNVTIHAGQNTDNTIAIAVDGKSFYLYVNQSQTPIKTVNVTRAGTGTQFGLVAFSQGNQTEVAYNSAFVWGP